MPCKGTEKPFTRAQAEDYLKKVSDWELVDNGSLKIRKKFKFEKYLEGIDFVNKVAKIAERDTVKKITISTKKDKEIIDITDDIDKFLGKQKLPNGLCYLFTIHTTCALTCADLDPGTDLDMIDAFEVLIPKLKFRHPHDPSHVPDHINSSLIGASLTLPFENKKLVLGTWQRAVLVEFNGPRERQIIIAVVATS